MFRYLLTSMIVVVCPMQVLGQNPDYHARLADLFLERVVPKEDWHRTRFISFMGIPEKDLPIRLKTMNFWLNNLHFEPSVELLREVPKSEGRLFWFFLDDYGWNASAWRQVTRREPYYVEPSIYPDVANSLRLKLGLTQDTKNFQIEAIVRADWLFRDSVETDRSPTYYDLLFAKQRFSGGGVEKKLVNKKIFHPGGDYTWYDGSVSKNVAAGNYDVQVYVETPSASAFTDFPQNEKAWLQVFGVDVIDDFLRKQKINAKHGAIVEEGASVVARGNRLLESVRIPTGTFWRTFDVTSTSDKRDFAEHLIYDFDFDAGELIANLPNGGQAYLLTLKSGKIVETADPKVAIDATDSRDRRVRTPGSCVVCHQSGIINPPNLVPDLLKTGIDIKFKDKKKAREVRGFFLDWEDELTADQKRYERLIKKTSGFEPGVNAAKFKEFRDFYDAPINAEQAARECGVPVEALKLVLARSPRVRHLQLVQDQTIPRSVWEAREYREAMLLLSLARTEKPRILEVEFK